MCHLYWLVLVSVSVLLLVGRCMAVDREFACVLLMCIYFCDLLFSFDCLWSSFYFPWSDFGLPFRSLWGALGFQGALLGVTLFPLWLPWKSVGLFGAPSAPKGSLG